MGRLYKQCLAGKGCSDHEATVVVDILSDVCVEKMHLLCKNKWDIPRTLVDECLGGVEFVEICGGDDDAVQASACTQNVAGASSCHGCVYRDRCRQAVNGATKKKCAANNGTWCGPG